MSAVYETVTVARIGTDHSLGDGDTIRAGALCCVELHVEGWAVRVTSDWGIQCLVPYEQLHVVPA